MVCALLWLRSCSRSICTAAAWTKARVHRLLGVVLYSAALLGMCLAAQRLQSRTSRQLGAARRLIVALCVYLGVSLGIPAAQPRIRQEPRDTSPSTLC